VPQRNLTLGLGSDKGDIIPRNHRAYVASHPLGVCVAAGLTVGGMINLCFPDLARETSVAVALPQVLFLCFSAMWALGGLLALYGLVRGKRSVEAGGSVLLSTALAVDYIAILSVRPLSGVVSVFIFFLAVGYALRVRHLLRTGYVDVAVPIGKP
jgi:hypothetical protein